MKELITGYIMMLYISGIDIYEGTNYGVQAALVIIVFFLFLLGVVITINLLQRWYVKKHGGVIK